MVREMEFANDDFDVDAEVVFAAEDFGDASAGILRGGGPVGDFDVDDYAFEIVPVGVAGGFFAQHAVDGVLLPLWPLCPLWLKVFKSVHHRGHRGHRGFRELHAFWDHDFLRNFWSMGVT